VYENEDRYKQKLKRCERNKKLKNKHINVIKSWIDEDY